MPKNRPHRRIDRTKQPAAPPVAPATEAKLFMNGRSQAVRLPAAFRFAGDTVWIKKWHGAVILLPKQDPWRPLLESIGKMSPDFFEERQPVLGVDDRPGLESLFD